METSENVVGSTEDIILTMLELLVGPLLPTRSSSRENPSPSEEESIAKQVHAVVILYNYFHRKNHPELEFLDFASFCKLAEVFKPCLLSYIQPRQSGDYTKPNDSDREFSLMGKKITEACDVSRNLCFSQDVSVVGWPINKVAVFLVDELKKNCLLLFNADTQGVWSVIEKEITDFSSHSEVKAEEKLGTKRKRLTKKPLKANGSINESSLHQQAIAAVKVACGCSRADLRLLEKHIVRSLSKEKTATFFCIMLNKQLNQEANYVPVKDKIQKNVPVKDVIHSLQEPLVKHESGRWTTTSAVEHFHLLPYANILLDWFHREEVNNQAEYIPTEMICGMKKTEDHMDLSDGTAACIQPSHEALGKKEVRSRGMASDILEYIETGKDLRVSNQGTCAGFLKQVVDIPIEMIGGKENTEEPMNLSDGTVSSAELSQEAIEKKEDYSGGKASDLLQYSETAKGLPISNQGTCCGCSEQVEDIHTEIIGGMKNTEEPMDVSDGTVGSNDLSQEAAGKKEDYSAGKASGLLQSFETEKNSPISNQGTCSNSSEQVENFPKEMIARMKNIEEFMNLTVASNELSQEALGKKENYSEGKASGLLLYSETGIDLPISNNGASSGSSEQVVDIPSEFNGVMENIEEPLDSSGGTVASHESSYEAMGKKEDCSTGKNVLQYTETRKDFSIPDHETCFASLEQVEDIPSVMIGGMKETEEPMDVSAGAVVSNKSSHEAVEKEENYSREKTFAFSQYIETGNDIHTYSESMEQVKDIPTEIGGMKKTEETMDLSAGTVASNKLSHEALAKEEEYSRRKTSVLSQFIETVNDLSTSNQGRCSDSLELVEDIPIQMIAGIKKAKESLDLSARIVGPNKSSHEAVEMEEDYRRGTVSDLSLYIETRNDLPISYQGTCSGSLEQVEKVLEAADKIRVSQPSPGDLIKCRQQLKDHQDVCRTDESHDTLVFTSKNSHKRKYFFGDSCSCRQIEATAEHLRLEKVEVDPCSLANYMDAGDAVVSVVCSHCGKTQFSGENYHSNKRKMIVLADNDKPPSSRDVLIKEETADKIIEDGLPCRDMMQDRALISLTSFNESVVKCHEIICSKDKILSETALRVLRSKKDLLSCHMRKIEDEIASIDQNIQKILEDGEDSLAVKLDSVLESCNNVNLRSSVEDKMLQSLHHYPDSALYSEKKTLPESDLSMCNPLEELDGVCQKKSWMSPNFHVSASEVFLAKVAVKGMDFELSTVGSVHDSPDGAKQSAASAMLIKLRNMASSS